MVDDVVGLHALSRPTPLAIAGGGQHSRVLEERHLQAVLKGRQGLPGIGFTGKGGTTQLLERFDFVVAALAEVVGHGALRPVGLGVDQEPALLEAALGRRRNVIPIALRQRGHGLRGSLSQDGLGLAHGGRDSRDPLLRQGRDGPRLGYGKGLGWPWESPLLMRRL